MTAGVRVAAFAALLAVIFAAASLAGRAIEPGTGSHGDDDHAAGDPTHAHTAAADPAHAHTAAADPAHAHTGTGDPAHAHTAAGDPAHAHTGAAEPAHAAPGAHAPAPAPAGLSLAQDGLRLVATDTTALRPHRTERLAFRIVDAHGATVRAFDVEQGRRMHLIVVRRDLTGYQHLHPAQTRDGTWTTPLRLPAAGAYRAFADFSTGGRRHTLGADLLAGGAFAPRPLPRPATSALVDGYDIVLHEQGMNTLSFSVRRRGTPVADLQPYLGARGHLVVLRAGDLAYEHVHPLAHPGAPGEIVFESATPTPGSYRLFLQFRHGGRVHTAAFTREVMP
jgi:hypothetical protein